MQSEHLVALPRVLQSALGGGFDPESLVLAMNAARALRGPGIDLDAVIAINAFDRKVRYA